MANPNIVNVTSIYGNTTYLTPSTTSATTWTTLTPASGTVNKVNNIVASNVTASAVAVTAWDGDVDDDRYLRGGPLDRRGAAAPR